MFRENTSSHQKVTPSSIFTNGSIQLLTVQSVVSSPFTVVKIEDKKPGYSRAVEFHLISDPSIFSIGLYLAQARNINIHQRNYLVEARKWQFRQTLAMSLPKDGTQYKIYQEERNHVRNGFGPVKWRMSHLHDVLGHTSNTPSIRVSWKPKKWAETHP